MGGLARGSHGVQVEMQGVAPRGSDGGGARLTSPGEQQVGTGLGTWAAPRRLSSELPFVARVEDRHTKEVKPAGWGCRA